MIDVYCHTSPSGKKYVGVSTAGWKARWRSHTFDARHGSALPLHQAIRKYGAGAFTHEVLQVCADAEEAATAEQTWIERLQTHVSVGGYNATLGGTGIHGVSQEARERIGAAHRGKTVSVEARARMSASRTGVLRGPQSPVHKAKISAANTGKRCSDLARLKIRAANLGKKASAETRAKMSAARTGRVIPASVCEKISRSNQKYPRLRLATAWAPAGVGWSRMRFDYPGGKP